MSLIITYIGSKGCVMIADKRRIGFFGEEKTREKLEEELYSGAIKTDEELLKKASSLGITLKITDDAEKIREIGDIVVGEVRFKTPFETKRKRIYGTTGAYNVVELFGSEIKRIKTGESAIVVFGNKVTKEIANKYIQKHWKKKTSLKDIGKIFKAAMGEVAVKTPSVSQKCDLFIKHTDMDKKQAKELLRTTILSDVKDLKKWRESLTEEMVKTADAINVVSKIIDHGEVGKVTNVQEKEVEVTLKKGVEALDLNFNLLAKPGDIIRMEIEDVFKVKIGDKVIINNETLCIKRTKGNLNCNVMLCKADKN